MESGCNIDLVFEARNISNIKTEFYLVAISFYVFVIALSI